MVYKQTVRDLRPQSTYYMIFRWLFGVFVFWMIFWGGTSFAQNKSEIWLYTPEQTYSSGRDLTIYVFFFRVPDAFFHSWANYIQHNNDFVVRNRERISGVREVHRDQRGFPQELFNLLYRVRLSPRSQAATLQYGPISLQMQINFQQIQIQSNHLSFRQRSDDGGIAEYQGTLTPPTGKLEAGQPLPLRYTIRCPQSRCNYRQLNHGELIGHLRDQVRLSPNRDFWVRETSVTPQIQYLDHITPQSVSISFEYKVYPLHGGNLLTPPLTVPLPVIESIDQRAVLTELRKWLVQRGISQSDTARLADIDQSHFVSVTTQPVNLPQQTLAVSEAPACRGQWQLTSKIVVGADAKTQQWHVRLHGEGFLLQADHLLRQQLEQTIDQHRLRDSLKLAHYRWQMPNRDLFGSNTIDLYFSFVDKRPDIPALRMDFIDLQSREYVRKTQAIDRKAPPEAMTESLALTQRDRRVYIAYDRQPEIQRPEEMEVWAYELPTNFPLFHMLSKRWQFDTALSLNRERKAAHITQRNVRTGPFGSMTQVYTQTVPIDVLTGRAMARKLEGIFAHFPAIKWGQQWVQLSIETANDLFVEAVTDRDSYFTGEPITYTFQINCPTNNCPPKESGFYEQIFSKQTELPKFEQYTGWRRTENFVRRETKQGWAAFRYSIQFNAPAEQNIQFKPARLRLSNHILQALYHRYQICLFQHQNREQLLKQAITRDHHKHSGGQDCALGTRELHNQPFSVSIQALPDAAKDIRLIGTFRLATRLSQLTYPTKRATVVDKPFYLIVDIEGDGDLQIARAQIRDQLDTLAGEMRKQGVTTYIELPDDQALLKEGKTLVQLQLIPEEITTFTIPSFKLRFFHRKSGLLTAQTLPIKIRVEPRDGQIIATKPQPSPSTTSDKAQIAAQATELRPNALIASQGLTNQYFQLYSWFNLVLLFGPFALFILFLFGHRLYLARQSDPQRLARQRAFSKCKAALRKIKPHANNQWPQSAISIAHSFFIERLTLSQKHFTPAELEDILRPFATSTGIKEHIDVVLQILQQLEASIYGGENIGEPQSLLRQLEHHLRQLERNLPKKQLTNSLAQFSWLILVPSLVMPTMAFAQTSATAPAPAHNQASTAIAASTSLTEQQRRDLFLRANQFYNAGQYQQAIAEFSSLLQKRKWANFAVYYNLGNCYYRLQQYGHALAFYKKARRIKPNDVDLLHNIQLIYRQLEKSEQLTDDLRAKFLFWYYLLNLRQLFYVVVIFTCLCLLVWVMHIRRSTRLDYGLRWPLAALFIFGVIIWFSFAIKIYQERYVTTAIVVQSRITARSGYGESYEPLFRLSEADEVIIKERIEISLPTGVQTWLRIETESPRDDQKILQKQIGWIPADTVTLIE